MLNDRSLVILVTDEELDASTRFVGEGGEVFRLQGKSHDHHTRRDRRNVQSSILDGKNN